MFLYCNVLLYVICHSQAARQTAGGLDQTKQTHLQQGKSRMWVFSVTVHTFIAFKYYMKTQLWLGDLDLYSSRIVIVLIATGIVKLLKLRKVVSAEQHIIFFFSFKVMIGMDSILLLNQDTFSKLNFLQSLQRQENKSQHISIISNLTESRKNKYILLAHINHSVGMWCNSHFNTHSSAHITNTVRLLH